MFYVIEKIFDAAGEQISSDTIATLPTEEQANKFMARCYEHGYDQPDDHGTTASFHVEAE